MRLAIFGSGGMGRDLLEAARFSVSTTGGEVVFVADEPQGPVFGTRTILPSELGADDELVIALGCSEQRRKIATRLAHIKAGTVIARTAIVGPGVELGEGSVLCDFTAVTTSTRIGRHFQGNFFSHIAHDCVIGDFVTFAPRVTCNGHVHIEDDVFIGAGAVIRNGSKTAPIVIGAGATVGMGAVVTKSVPPGATVVGNPARPLAK